LRPPFVENKEVLNENFPARRADMKHRLLALAISLAILTAVAVNQTAAAQADARSQERISREVRHELLMLPWFGVFDYIAFKVDGGTVTVMGQVVRPSLKSDAENAVKRIEGVERVENKIEVLPPSSIDDGLRLALYRAIYGDPSLEKYALGVQKPIRIIVKNGHVTLEGVVDSEADKNLVTLRANSVPGIFSVTNNLQVVPAK
jgi:hyperosmotically inducible protein